MSYIKDRLQPGEEIHHTVRISPAVFLSPFFFFFLSLVAVIISVEQARIYTENAAALAVLFFLLAVFLFSGSILGALLAAARMLTTVLAVTDRRVVGRTGLFHRRPLDLSLTDIQGVEVKQNIFGRLFRAGTLTIMGKDGIRFSFKGIKDPIGVKSKIDHAHG
ncbi:MAG: PH domain-containing protein [Anaerolineaceae bacterium]